MNGPLRIALAGVEHYHANFWTKAILQSPKATVAGIWDRDAALKARFAHAHGVDAADDLETLLGECDGVAICSATVDHGPLIAAAARAGRPVLCEKPLALSQAEGRTIAATVAEAGIAFMQSFPKRFDPVTHAVREIVASGDLGRLTLCRVRHGHSHGLSEDFHRAWFVDPAKSGGGTLLDEGVHAADFLRFVLGEPERVQATISSAALGLDVEDTALATFAYEGGLIAEVATSWCFAAADTSIEIYGTGGTVLVTGVDIASRPTHESGFLRVFRREGPRKGWETSKIVPHFKTGIFHEHVAWAFIDALAEGRPMPVGIEAGLRAFAMIDAAYAAARSGAAQTISYPRTPA